MKFFLRHKTAKKIKIILIIFTIVNIVLFGILINDFLYNNIPFLYILFIIPGLLLSLFFRKDKTIVWDDKLEKVVKNTEITTILLIISIVLVRRIVFPEIFREFNIIFITDATLLITLGFFSGKLYFMWNKLKCIFSDVCDK